MGRKMFGAAIAMVLAFLAPGLASAQSMDGWQRVPEAQLKFEADHAACTAQATPPPLAATGKSAPMGSPLRSKALPPGLPTGGAYGGTDNPVKPQVVRSPDPQSFAKCMRARGWVKP